MPTPTTSPVTGGTAFRIRKDDYIVVQILNPGAALTFMATARIRYDDGTVDRLTIPSSAVGAASGQSFFITNKRVDKNGWVTNFGAAVIGGGPAGGCWATAWIVEGEEVSAINVRHTLCEGPLGVGSNLVLGMKVRREFDWTYIFQGTIASDATVGTHVCTATFSFSGAANSANEALICGGQIILTGAAGLAVSANVQDDSGNTLYSLLTQTTAGTWNFPNAVAASGTVGGAAAGGRYFISGAMSLVLTATTSTVSSTQTFGLQLRLRAARPPSVTLNDTVGTSVNTTNTSKVI